jgi:predicted transcriptional regulator
MEELKFSNLVIDTGKLRERLIKAIVKHPIGRVKLSKAMGIDYYTLLKFMRGKTNFQLEVLIRIENWVRSKGE